MISDKRYKYDKAGNSIANMFSDPIDMQAGSTDSSSVMKKKTNIYTSKSYIQ